MMRRAGIAAAAALAAALVVWVLARLVFRVRPGWAPGAVAAAVEGRVASGRAWDAAVEGVARSRGVPVAYVAWVAASADTGRRAIATITPGRGVPLETDAEPEYRRNPWKLVNAIAAGVSMVATAWIPGAGPLIAGGIGAAAAAVDAAIPPFVAVK